MCVRDRDGPRARKLLRGGVGVDLDLAARVGPEVGRPELVRRLPAFVPVARVLG